MSLPSCLYFRLPGSTLPPVLLASKHCMWDYLPSMWRVLLADAQLGDTIPPMSGERGEATLTIHANAEVALERLAHFTGIVDGHPLLHRIEDLPVFLEGALAFLVDRIKPFAGKGMSGVEIVAQIGSNDFPEDMPEYLLELREDWEAIEEVGKSGDYHRLDELLYFSRGRMSFKQWKPWVERFGLSSLAHPYFTRLEYSGYWEAYHDAPSVVSYEQFKRDTGESRPGLLAAAWGAVKRTASTHGLAPKARARHSEREETTEEDEQTVQDRYTLWRHTGYYPEKAKGKFGLRVLEEQGEGFTLGALAMDHQWDELAMPCGEAAWARRGGMWSLIELGPQCTVTFENCCDEIFPYDYSHTTCIVRSGSKHGLVNAYERRWLARAEYSKILCYDDDGHSFWRVQRGDKWGLLDDEGSVLQACIFDSLEMDIRGYPYTGYGWQVTQNGRYGWLTVEGQWEVECEWDDIAPHHARGLYGVRRGALWGLMARGGAQWLPCMYASVEPVALGSHLGPVSEPPWLFVRESIWPDDRVDVPSFIAGKDPSRANVIIAVSTPGGMGLVDQASRTLIPCTWKNVEFAQSGTYQDSRWVRLTDAQGRQGLWSIEQGKQVVACEHEVLEVIVGPNLAQPLVGTVDKLRYRLWNTDGTPAFGASAFRWLRADEFNWADDIGKGLGSHDLGDVAEYWSKGMPVRAALIGENGAPDMLVHLLPGRPIESEQDSLTRRYREQGDYGAALMLATTFRDGFMTVQDDVLARMWAARACGHEATPVPPVRRVPDPDNDVSEYDICKEEAEVFAKAALLFATMLAEGRGGPRNAPLARHWAEQVYERETLSSDKSLVLLLGRLLLDDSAGPPDPARANELLAQISAPALQEGEACYYRALIERDGLAGPRDLHAARELLTRADAGGFEAAAPALVSLLHEMADGEAEDEAQCLRDEADYFDAKRQDAEAMA